MIVVFLLIIGSLNYYLYSTVVSGVPDASGLVAAIIVFLFSSLFVAILLERKKIYRLSIFFSWIGYSWLGVMGIAVFVSSLFDLLQLFYSGIDDREAFLCIASLVSVLTVWSFYSARAIRVKGVCLRTRPGALLKEDLLVVQITDLHLGDSSTLKRTKWVVDTVNALQPDVIVSTGDLFDGFLDRMDPYVEVLKRLETRLGKFAVSGNHEVYAGLSQAMDLTEKAGFQVLRNRSLELGNGLAIIGVDDPACSNNPDEVGLLSEVKDSAFALLLKHRPDLKVESLGLFDLQLSGHTHGGQIFPFHFLVKLVYRAKPGLTRHGERSRLYLSRGTGAWGPQMRLFSGPEITCFRISSNDD